jgi:hypothetical protein
MVRPAWFIFTQPLQVDRDLDLGGSRASGFDCDLVAACRKNDQEILTGKPVVIPGKARVRLGQKQEHKK